jgi:hypothetical protein
MLGAKQEYGAMAQVELFYSSENGDRWFLIHEFGADRAFVRHKANLASGGCVTDMEIDAFLGPGRAGPEHVALRRVLDAAVGGG